LFNKTSDNIGIELNLPGDISSYAKQYGPQIPLKEVILSYSNFVLLISTIDVIIFISWLVWPKIKFQLEKKEI
jgi:short subunit fatty acids transporter